MSEELGRAEWALFDRAGAAGGAATAVGVAGRFAAWRPDGLLAVLATDPGLGFLATVSGVRADTVASVPAVLRSSTWEGARPAVVAAVEFGDALSDMGLVAAGERALAIRRLDDLPAAPSGVTEADDSFAGLLIAGYEVTGVVADYIRAEHTMSGVTSPSRTARRSRRLP